MSIATQIVQGSNFLPFKRLGKCTGIKKAPAIVNCLSPLHLQRSRFSTARRYRSGVDRKQIAGVVLASSGDGVETKIETEQILSGEWPENFSMLNFEDLSSYFEPMIFKEEAQPGALLADVMSKAIYIARPDQLLEEIDNNFESVTGLPVVDKDLKCIGVISKKDKAKASKGLKSSVGEVMSSPAITLSAEKTVLDAAVLMLKSKIHRIPIINDQAQVVGIVTRTDIFNALEGLPG